MHDTKERLSLFWIFALLNYLYADVVALFAIVGSPNLVDAPHLPPWALLGSAVLMEIPIAMIVACRLLPFRANRLANIIAGAILTLVNGFLTFVPPLVGARTPALPEYLFFATIETVCTSVIIWQAWTWSGVEAAVSSERIVRQPETRITSSSRSDCSKMYSNDPRLWRPPCRPRTAGSMSVIALFTTVDCGLSTSTRWISSVIANFGLLPCVLFCESSA